MLEFPDCESNFLNLSVEDNDFRIANKTCKNCANHSLSNPERRALYGLFYTEKYGVIYCLLFDIRTDARNIRKGEKIWK